MPHHLTIEIRAFAKFLPNSPHSQYISRLFRADSSGSKLDHDPISRQLTSCAQSREQCCIAVAASVHEIGPAIKAMFRDFSSILLAPQMVDNAICAVIGSFTLITAKRMALCSLLFNVYVH